MRWMLSLLIVLAMGVDAQTFPATISQDELATAHPRLTVQIGHAFQIWCVSLSPDGRLLATGGFDGVVHLWDVATGREIRRFEGHTYAVHSIAFSADGRRLVSGSRDGTARLWDMATGTAVRKFAGHSSGVSSVALSADGRNLVTGSFDGVARLWDVETGEPMRQFRGHADWVRSVALLADGGILITGSRDGTVRLWDVASGEELRKFGEPGHVVNVAALAADGLTLVTGSSDGVARLWNVATGKEMQKFEEPGHVVNAAALSADSLKLVTGGSDGVARLWDVAAGKEIRTFAGHTGGVTSLALSTDGQQLVTGSNDGTARLWNAATGEEIRKFQDCGDWVLFAAFSPDGRYLVTGNRDRTARLWDLTAGKEMLRFQGHTDVVASVALSSDGRRMVTGSYDGTAQLWDMATGKTVRKFAGHTGQVKSVALSADGTRLATGSYDGTARLWDVEAGTEIRRFEGHTYAVYSVALSADGTRLLTGSQDGTARLWDTATGKAVGKLEGHTSSVTSVALSSDSLVTGSRDGTARLWDVATGRTIRKFEGHTDGVTCVALSADGKHLATASHDMTARLWDLATGKEMRRFSGHTSPITSVTLAGNGQHLLTAGFYDKTARLWKLDSDREVCQIISFADGWAVVDPQGRYDASNGGDVEGLYWVIGNEPVSLDQLKTRYYEPGLLAKIAGFNQEPLRDVLALESPGLHPDIDIGVLTKEDQRLAITVTNRGGGIGRVVVKINGKELTADARAAGFASQSKIATLEVDLAGDPRLKPGAENQIEVFAFNAEGYLRSRGHRLSFTPPGERTVGKPDVWAIVTGVSDYRGNAIDLQYAAKDAEDFATALRVAASRLFGAEKVHLTVLSTEQRDDSRRPSRANLVKALHNAKQAKPEDILVVYLAGHGINHDDDYYYLTSDADAAELRDVAVRDHVAVSSRQLTEAINQIPALKQVLVLDTCASGQLIQELTQRRDTPSSQVRSLERLKDRTGTYVLTGCAADAVSYETSQYGQGLLTYSLLLGMRGAALREEQFVDVDLLFAHAVDCVPELAKGIGGVQRPEIAIPKGGSSFAIGQVTAQDTEAIPLRTARPLVLRASLQEKEQFRDVLQLAKLVDEQLRNASSGGAKASFVFVDAREFPAAYSLAGQYGLVGDTVTVEANLFKGDQRIDRISTQGSKSELEALAKEIVEKLRQSLERKT